VKKDQQYELIDSGNGRKLERFGSYLLSRPCSQAVWAPQKTQKEWDLADASFSREQENRWTIRNRLPTSWSIELGQLLFKISPTDFGHVGIFPEQESSWKWLQEKIQKKMRVLNLFAYSGGSTLAAAKAGASACHLDASKGMVTWARENAELNELAEKPIRWIVEDVKKFLLREIKRGSLYEGIILDPPTFGRGANGEIFKIEEEIIPLLEDCRRLLSDRPSFVLFSCHTPGFSPLVMQHLMTQSMSGLQGSLEVGEMCIDGKNKTFDIPSGTYAKWEAST
jgi:23S rRNA (cytosine1962-C5)-methyltransferase